MIVTYSADEIFTIAEDIERNAAEFYHEAAERSSNGESRHFLLTMADVENKHLNTFRSMREKLFAEEESSILDTISPFAEYLQTLVDVRTWEGR